MHHCWMQPGCLSEKQKISMLILWMLNESVEKSEASKQATHIRDQAKERGTAKNKKLTCVLLKCEDFFSGSQFHQILRILSILSKSQNIFPTKRFLALSWHGPTCFTKMVSVQFGLLSLTFEVFKVLQFYLKISNYIINQ